jgi:hypothetical protein
MNVLCARPFRHTIGATRVYRTDAAAAVTVIGSGMVWQIRAMFGGSTPLSLLLADIVQAGGADDRCEQVLVCTVDGGCAHPLSHVRTLCGTGWTQLVRSPPHPSLVDSSAPHRVCVCVCVCVTLCAVQRDKTARA